MEFPRSLAPWAQILNVFPRETSLALGPLIQRLSIAIGPMRSLARTDSGDPDGFDGIARKGSYERLLISEWLLADELPEEFARRAAMGEHLFFHIARREPAASRVSLALFDAGPNQLGSPRIAHLAALIVLARRAEAAGARFAWGILQHPEQKVFPDVTESGVMRLVDGRSLKETTRDELAAWISLTSDWHELDDFWIVGGPRVARFHECARLSHLLVRDVLLPDARKLAVTVRGVSGAMKEISLELPDDRACARLLRDPFSVSVASPRMAAGDFAPLSNLVFDSGGRNLFARSTGNRIISYPVPNSPRAGTGSPKLLHATGGKLVTAVGRFNRVTCMLTAHDQRISYEYVGRRSPNLPEGLYYCANNESFQAAIGSESQLQPCFRLPQKFSTVEAIAMDARGSMFRLEGNRHASVTGRTVVGTVYLWASSVLAITPLVQDRVVYVGIEHPAGSWRIVSLGADVEKRDIPFDGTPTRAFFAHGGSLATNKFGLLALEKDFSEWTVISARGDLILSPPSGANIVGFARHIRKNEPGLLALEDDRRALTLYGNQWQHEILTAPAAISHLAVSHAAPNIAYSTIEGEVIVYSLAYEAALCRFLPRGKP